MSDKKIIKNSTVRRVTLTPKMIENGIIVNSTDSYMKLTPAIIDKYADKLVWQKISFGENIPKELIGKLLNKLDWDETIHDEGFFPVIIDTIDWNIIP